MVASFWKAQKPIWTPTGNSEYEKLLRADYLWRVALEQQKNFGLTESAFAELKGQLSEGSEKLFEHIFLAHFKDCQQYVMQQDNAPEEVAYDATMDAFITFRQRLVDDKVKYGNLRFLLTRMARQHYYKRAKKESTVALDLILDPSVEPDVIFEPSLYDLLDRGWKTLTQECRELLRAFYYQGRALKDIGEETGTKPDTMRKKKQRCQDQLKTACLASAQVQ